MKYQCHMNLEITSGKGRVIKYLYKYVLKGPDYVSFQIVPKSSRVKQNIRASPKTTVMQMVAMK